MKKLILLISLIIGSLGSFSYGFDYINYYCDIGTESSYCYDDFGNINNIILTGGSDDYFYNLQVLNDNVDLSLRSGLSPLYITEVNKNDYISFKNVIDDGSSYNFDLYINNVYKTNTTLFYGDSVRFDSPIDSDNPITIGNGMFTSTSTFASGALSEVSALATGPFGQIVIFIIAIVLLGVVINFILRFTNKKG